MKVVDLLPKIEESKKRLKKFKAEEIKLQEELDNYNTLLKYTQKVVEDKLKEVKEKIEPLVNKALEVIFTEDDYRFTFESKVLRDRTQYIPLIREERKGIEGTTEAFGGGVNIIVSLILRILFITLQEGARVIVLDESLNQLSPMYREKASKFLREVCEELDFTIILINFDENGDYEQEAHRVYEAVRDGSFTKFKVLKK